MDEEDEDEAPIYSDGEDTDEEDQSNNPGQMAGLNPAGNPEFGNLAGNSFNPGQIPVMSFQFQPQFAPVFLPVAQAPPGMGPGPSAAPGMPLGQAICF